MPINDVLERELNPEQRAVALDQSDTILCLACAGSGKTTTLAYRTARLLADGADPRGIVAFTFTEKAAESLKRRIASALQKAGLEPTLVGAMYVGTIHSYCQYVLGEMDARYRQFDVLDENRLLLYLMSRYPQLRLDGLRRARGNARYFDVIREVADAWKIMNDEMLAPADIGEHDPALGLVLDFMTERMERDQFIDFSLMIRLVVDALRRNDQGALRAISELRHLMVDEYQDVNTSQEMLIRELKNRAESLLVVGDDDQAIYAWRGADVSNILTFSERYPGCSEHTLSHNYRSTRSIVRAADFFVSAELGAARIPKHPDADNPPGPQQFGCRFFTNRAEEARWVVERISDLLGTSYTERDGTTRGLTPGDFAILMRSTRTAERDGTPRHAPFTDELERRNIPYTLDAGGGVFDRPQVAALKECFEILRERSPNRTEVRELFDRWVAPAYPHADFNALAQVLATWGRLIHAPHEGVRRRVYPQQLVHDLLHAFGLAQTNFDDGTMADLGVFSKIMQDVESVYVSIDSAQRFRDVLNFLSNVAERGYDAVTDDVVRRPDAVTVSTVHRVKGLEFPVVFVVDVEAGRFPGRERQYTGWLPENVIQGALLRGAYRSTRDEEARLFYTAITRAERYLYVTGAANLPGGAKTWKESPFTQRLSQSGLMEDPATPPEGLTRAEPRQRIDETVVPTTYSDIRYYLKCPKDYQLRKCFGFSPPITEMFGFGKTVHTAVTKLHEVFRNRPPTEEEAAELAGRTFHLKHVPPSNDPVNRPGGYERARESAKALVRDYAREYSADFMRRRQVEARFEVPVQHAVISGSIDLMLQVDESGQILEASVIDFKAMEGGADPETNERLHWTELSLQVQLYAKAAREILGENARTGAVHLLKDNRRIIVPVSDEAIEAAVANVEWAVERILDDDFPMRPHPDKCRVCDFAKICARTPQDFKVPRRPPAIYVPGSGRREMVRAFSEYEG